MKPELEVLEDRCLPTGTLGINAWNPMPPPAPTYPTPPAGYQIILVQDILNNAPFIPGQGMWAPTPAEPKPVEPFVNVAAIIRDYPVAGYINNGQSAYWFVPNEVLPASFVPGPSAPVAPQHHAPPHHVAQAFVGNLTWMASFVHHPKASA